MTANDTATTLTDATAPRPFVTLKELAPQPLPELSDDELKVWIMEQLQADKKTLDLLATL